MIRQYSGLPSFQTRFRSPTGPAHLTCLFIDPAFSLRRTTRGEARSGCVPSRRRAFARSRPTQHLQPVRSWFWGPPLRLVWHPQIRSPRLIPIRFRRWARSSSVQRLFAHLVGLLSVDFRLKGIAASLPVAAKGEPAYSLAVDGGSGAKPQSRTSSAPLSWWWSLPSTIPRPALHEPYCTGNRSHLSLSFAPTA